MSVHRAVSKVFLAVSLVFGSATAAAKVSRKSRTVGDLLNKIESNTKKVSLKKSQGKLPQFKKFQSPRAHVNLQAVKPPSSKELYYDKGTKDADLMVATDRSIDQLYKLSRQFKNSSRRGEIWLRLAEAYSEKARLIEYKLSKDFDEKNQQYLDKKIKKRPKLDLAAAQVYNKKAIQLYQWFLRDFPKDEKVDQALFFLGYNYFELGDSEQGKKYYSQLTKEHPKSPFNEEAAFALGEYYFERNDFEKALSYYSTVAKDPRARLYSFSKYKLAWTQYKLGKMKEALKSLEAVINAGKKGSDHIEGGVSRIRLGDEASKDLIVFYAEVGTPQRARSYFENMVGEKRAGKLVEKLAYYYADRGNTEGARYLFKSLIQEAPRSEEAFEYKYQIVSLYASSSTSKEFRGELFDWINDYGPKSSWQQAQSGKKDLIEKVNKLMESTLRNHILQLHQTAQNSHAPFSQKMAKEGYQLYFKTFDTGEKIDEMHFFYAELLFDMNEYEAAAFHYNWVVKNAPKSPYAEKSKLNTVLALEKTLPSEQDLKKNLGDSLDPIPLEKNVKNFIIASKQYIEVYPKGENVPAIRYKMGALYYYHNQFDEALDTFNTIIKEHPKSKYAGYAANLTLDIYNLKKDFAGLQKAGEDLLKNQDLAQGQVGNQVKSVLQQVSFKKAQELEASKDYLGSAQAFESFAAQNKASDLAPTALFNAAVNYERSNDLSKSAEMHKMVLASKADKGVKGKSEKILPSLYEKLGDYRKAAQAMEAYYKSHPKDKEALDYLYNAAVIQDGMNWQKSASQNYEEYFNHSKSKDRFDALFLLGKVWEKRGGITKAAGYYSQFYTSPTKDKSAVVEAAFRTAEIYRKKGKKADRDTWLDRTIASQKKLSSKDDAVGASFAAQARFQQVKEIYDELVRVKIPANPSAQKAAVEKKLGLLNKLKEQLKSVITYNDGSMVVASLTLIAQANRNMVEAIHNTPAPKGLDEDGMKQYKAGVAQLAAPFEKTAIENYKSAIDRGFDLKGYSDWLLTAQKELAEIQPDEFSFKGERFNEVQSWDRFESRLSAPELKDLKFAADGGNEAKTVAAAGALLGKDQNNLEALMALATLHYDKKEFGLSELILTRALKAHSEEAAIYQNLGILALGKGDLMAAVASFEKAGSLNKNYALAAQSLGSIYLKYHDFKRAYDSLKPVVSDDVKSVDLANGFAVASSYVGESNKALKVYNKILEKDGQNTDVLLNKAILLAERIKRKSEATEALNKLKFLTDDKGIQKKVAELEAKISQLKD
jgi:tetratricopeptide (TPR) repeat protein